MGKKRLFFLVVLLIASLETTNMMVGGNVECEEFERPCLFKCYTGTGKCMQCCKDHGYIHGECQIMLDDFCFCCKNYTPPHAAIVGYHGQQPQTVAQAPRPHFLYVIMTIGVCMAALS